MIKSRISLYRLYSHIKYIKINKFASVLDY